MRVGQTSLHKRVRHGRHQQNQEVKMNPTPPDPDIFDEEVLDEGQDATSDYKEVEMDGSNGEYGDEESSVTLSEWPSTQLETRLRPNNATPFNPPTLAKTAPRGKLNTLGR